MTIAMEGTEICESNRFNSEMGTGKSSTDSVISEQDPIHGPKTLLRSGHINQ